MQLREAQTLSRASCPDMSLRSRGTFTDNYVKRRPPPRLDQYIFVCLDWASEDRLVEMMFKSSSSAEIWSIQLVR